MAEHVVKLPDVGEGVAQAELVEWHVKPGDLVREDAILAAVMTDKATVEIPSPVEGEILSLGADIGDMVAVGSELIRLKVAGRGDAPAGQHDGGGVEEGSGGLEGCLEVLGEAAVAADPGEEALDDQRGAGRRSRLVEVLANDLDGDGGGAATRFPA